MIKHPTNRLDRLKVATKRLKKEYSRPTHVKRRAKQEAAEKEAIDELHGEFLE